ncbi:MAG: DUF2059 domain-containing protein [Gammaproteobacteria bacterium]
MKTVLVVVLMLWGSGAFAATTQPSPAASIAPAKRADILKLLHVTGALDVGLKMGTQMANGIIASVKRTHPSVSNQAIEDIQQAVQSTMTQPSVKTRMVNSIVTIYAKYYSDADIRGMLRFDQTPLGQKIMRTLPKVGQESVAAGLAIARSFRGELIDKIKQNLTRDHINLKTLQPEGKD